MKQGLKLLTGAAAFALLGLSSASAQDVPQFEVYGDNANQIEAYAGLSADDWASRFIGLAQMESGIAADAYRYDPDDLESMRLYIWTKLEDLTYDLRPVVSGFDQKAHELDDTRNIKIAAMLQAFLKTQLESLSSEDYDARMSDITRPYARDNDWFVVFFANALNFEAVFNDGSIFDPSSYADFAEFALKGHEVDLDFDEAQLIYLRIRIHDHLRRTNLEGFYDSLKDRNNLKAQFGLPRSDFADLINAASLHSTIFTDPSTIRIAEEAFHSDELSEENIEVAKYSLGDLYTVHGFSDKALEIYKNIELSDLPSDRESDWLVQSIELAKALNYALLGDMDEARNILNQVNKVEIAYYDRAKFQYDLLEVVLHETDMTPAKKADILETIKTFRNSNILTRLEMAPEFTMQSSKRASQPIVTQVPINGDLEDLQPLSQVEIGRIQSFITLAADNLGGSSKASPREKTIATALQALGAQSETKLNDRVRQLRQNAGDQPLADLFDLFRKADMEALKTSTSELENTEHKTIGELLQGRLCLKQADYGCAWEHLYAAREQARSVGRPDFVDFLIADSELSLMSHENNSSAVLRTATKMFETQSRFFAEPDMAYDVINRVATAFERTGLIGTANQIITLDGAAGMAQPYANHMTEVRNMLALSRYREARDRLDTLTLEGGPLRQTLYEKALNYAAHAALGETDEALGLAEEVRTGIAGLKDPLLSSLVEPYLLMGDYHVYTHYRPFEAEEYRARYLEARRMEDALQVEKSRRLAEARVRAINAAEMQALERARGNLDRAETGQATFARIAALLALLTALLLFGWFRMRGRQKVLTAENQELQQLRQTHEYFMGEMERQTEIETTALGAVMDTLTRGATADPTLVAQKVGDHAGRLRETISRLAFQNRVFTGADETRTKLDVDELAASLSTHFQDMASRKDVSLHFDVHERVRTVHVQKALLSEALRTFLGHAIEHTSCDVIEVSLRPLAYKDQTYLRAVITDEGDGLAKFDHRLSEGDLSPDMAVRLNDAQTRGFSADTVIMAINKADGRFESEAAPGFGHTLTFDLPATLLGAETPPTSSNIVEFKKGTANDG